MAYKFQVGPAILSGSTTFEDAVSAASVTSVGASTAATLSASAGVSGASVSADGNGSFGDLTVGTDKLLVGADGVITLGGAADTPVDIAADSFYFRDADGSLKRDTLADYATAIAGDGLAASSGSLAVGVDDSSIEINADALRLKDAGVTLAKMAANSVDSAQYVDGSIDFAHFAAGSVSGSALADAGIGNAKLLNNAVTLTTGEGMATLGAVALGGTITVGLSASVGGAGLAYSTGVLSLDIDELVALGGATVAQADKFLMSDDGTEKTVSFTNLEDSIFANVSGDATVAAGGVLTIAAGAVENSMLAADAVDGSKLADDSVDSEHIVDGSIDLAHMSANSVDSDQYVDGSIESAHIATSVAGLGLSGGGGSALALDLNELTAEVLASGDFLAFVDSTDNGTHKETIDDLAVFMAGPGLGAQSGSLGVTVDGATLEVDTDTVQVKDGGITLAKMAVNSVDSNQYVDGSIDLIHMSANSVDSDQYVDGSIETDHIADSQITLGKMAANSVDSDQYVDGSIESAHIATSVAGDGLSGGGGSALALDLNELTAADVDVAADSFAIIDGGDNSSKKESIADFVSAVAGAGLTATDGVLKVTGNNVAARADGETLTEGYNYFANLSAAATVTLPASPSVGDTVTVKGMTGVSQTNYIQINKAGSQTIDGQGSIRIESEYGAVTMVYVASNDWRLV